MGKKFCNYKLPITENIYNRVDKLLSNKDDLEKQVQNFVTELNKFKKEKPSKLASTILVNHF